MFRVGDRLMCHRRNGNTRRKSSEHYLSRESDYPLTPVEAMLLTKARWKARNNTSTGMVISVEYAMISPQWTLSCWK